MKKEFSAGGIIFKKIRNPIRQLADEIRNQNVMWLVAQHSQHKGWVFPKGLIGDHKEKETSKETAVREVEEETGIKGKILVKLEKPAAYFYVWQGEKRFKTVDYYLMEYVSGDISKHDMEMSAVEWLSTDEVAKRLTYKSDKEAFQEALKLFEILPSSRV